MGAGLRTWIATIALTLCALGAGPLTGEAKAAVCAGVYDAGTATLIRYDATADTCTISDSGTVPGIDNSFALLLNPSVGPDRYSGVKYTTGGGYQPSDSLIVGGIVGSPGTTSNAVFHDFPGAVLAIVLADLYGQTYRLVANLIADGGETISILDASVSPVPLPAALPLFAAALGGMGLARWRGRRRMVRQAA